MSTAPSDGSRAERAEALIARTKAARGPHGALEVEARAGRR